MVNIMELVESSIYDLETLFGQVDSELITWITLGTCAAEKIRFNTLL